MPRPPNDPDIADSDRLWRRLQPSWLIEEDDGTVRISSAAFWMDGEVGEISVNVARRTSVEQLLAAHPTHSIGDLEAAFPRNELNYSVAFEEEPGNPGHAHMYPPETFTRSARKKARAKMGKKALIIEQRTPAIRARQ